MSAKGLCLLWGIAVLSGCMHNTSADRAFTKDWSHQLDKEHEFQSRQNRIEGKGRALVGKPGKTQAIVETNDEGKSKLRVGKDTGLSAGMNVDGLEPDVEVKYRLKW